MSDPSLKISMLIRIPAFHRSACRVVMLDWTFPWWLNRPDFAVTAIRLFASPNWTGGSPRPLRILPIFHLIGRLVCRKPLLGRATRWARWLEFLFFWAPAFSWRMRLRPIAQN